MQAKKLSIWIEWTFDLIKKIIKAPDATKVDKQSAQDKCVKVY